MPGILGIKRDKKGKKIRIIRGEKGTVAVLNRMIIIDLIRNEIFTKT